MIETDAFKNCKELISILIPESVIKIWSNAFRGCDNLKNIFFLSSTPPELYEYSLPLNNTYGNRMNLYINMKYESSYAYHFRKSLHKSLSFYDFHVHNICFVDDDIHYVITGLNTVKVTDPMIAFSANPYEDYSVLRGWYRLLHTGSEACHLP